MTVSEFSKAPEILIVGSGPSGLILALSLMRNGVPVRVIEKSTTNRIGTRGSGLMPRSLETFEFLGILDQVLKRGMAVPDFRVYKMPGGVEILKDFSGAPYIEPTPSKPHMNGMILGQDNLDKIIRTELDKMGCTIDLGVELLSFEQDDKEGKVHVKLAKHDLTSHVQSPYDSAEPSPTTIIEEASYKWVIGADGARGVVRKQLGLSFLGETSEQRMLTGDIKIEGLINERFHLWGDLGDTLTVIRGTETPGLFNYIIGSPKLLPELKTMSDIAADHERVKVLLRQTTGNREDIKWGEVICAFPYIVHVRMVDKFKKGRVFVVGDAAHIHSPAGGQGMNTGVQDSFNLGWKLALVEKGLALESLLETYEEERLPVVAEMLNITRSIFNETLSNSTDENAWNRTGKIDQLGVNYRWSSIVVDEESEKLRLDRNACSAYSVDGGTIRAGDRANDAPGLVVIKGTEDDLGKTRLFELFKPTRHTVLIFAGKVDPHKVLAALPFQREFVHPIIISKRSDDASVPAVSISSNYSGNSTVVEDREHHAYAAYNGPEGLSGVFVIRPDGVVGARVGDVKGLKAYFKGVLGETVA